MLAAERNDLGSTIDRHVIPQLMLAIAGTGDRHIISLSTNSILDFSFPNWFQRMLKETEVEGSQLILQVSAIVAESNLKPTRRVIDELQLWAVILCLSEFDNDRRTIQLLEHLPVSMIKLRPGLAQGLSSNTANQEIIRAVVRAVEATKSPSSLMRFRTLPTWPYFGNVASSWLRVTSSMRRPRSSDSNQSESL